MFCACFQTQGTKSIIFYVIAFVCVCVRVVEMNDNKG